jgi:hypothetical protein
MSRPTHYPPVGLEHGVSQPVFDVLNAFGAETNVASMISETLYGPMRLAGLQDM